LLAWPLGFHRCASPASAYPDTVTQAGRDALIFVGGKDVGVNGDRSQRDAVSGPRGRRQHQVRRRRDGQRRPVVLGQVVGVKAQPVV